MKNKWKSLAVALALVGNTISMMPVSAAHIENNVNSETISPWYVGVSTLYAEITGVGADVVKCIGRTRVKAGYSVVMTMRLEKNASGIWKTVQTWTKEGVASDSTVYVELVETKSLTAEGDYRLCVSLVVKDSNGVVVETPSTSSEYCN